MEKRHFLRQIDDWKRTYGHKTTTQLYNLKDRDSLLQLTYDYAVDELSLRWINYVEPIGELFVWSRFDSLGPDLIYRWAQWLRGVIIYDAAAGTTTVRPYQLDIREARTHIKFSPPPPCQHPMGDSDPDDCLRMVCSGDREVLCVVSDDGVQLWFFNPDFVPDIPGAEPLLAREESG